MRALFLVILAASALAGCATTDGKPSDAQRDRFLDVAKAGAEAALKAFSDGQP